jgi:phosphatidylserine decarboxylase
LNIKAETQFPIVKEGFVFIFGGLLLTWITTIVIGRGVGIFFGLLTLFVTWFFRDPHRVVPSEDGLVVSPADGVVLSISKIDEVKFIKGKAIKMSIFLNVFNVHITRVPVEGRVLEVVYNAGRFFAANVPKASLENEQNTVIIETPLGKKIVLVQIAGFIARRIVCWIQPGAVMNRGERFGLIRFGSRVDLIFPEAIDLQVAKGDRVWGGKTILGKLS